MSRRKRQSRTRPEAVPPALLERLAEILGADGLRAWQAGARPAPVAGRVNTLLTEVPAVHDELRADGFDLERVPWLSEAFTVPPAQREALTRSQAVAAGRVYLQNLSSMLPPYCLAPEPGMEVLDLAAAPGSKTLQMAAMMANEGRLAAVERSRPRFHKLRANCRRAGADCVRLYLKDGTMVGRLTAERFDRVLVDAPCSSEARIDASDPASAADWSEKKIRRLAGLQRRLLSSGLEALRPGGRLVYSTCTFAPEENEAVVAGVLSQFDGAVSLLPADIPVTSSSPGLTVWRGTTLHPSLRCTARILPDGVMEGFYLAVFTKRASFAAGG
ncbi:RsmB/NOP family class I SAM-dependent RNA methyltransferase [Ectothiorhodospiraceae bacterium WFHF3C12]|nr:RsmB/NOP family class I SAM-dependent RNA methyltransferase [Ectothiorhodospiraceae bacterium WFHF3C12]